MTSVDFLIIGGSAAGTTAAEVIRLFNPQSSVTIITDENHEQYSRVLLPQYVRRKITREQVFLKKPTWYQEKNIELTKGTKAQKLDPLEHVITCANGESYKYGKLLIAIGGDVVSLTVPGADLKNIFYFRSIEDGDEIIKVGSQSRKAVIVGGGLISLDFATGFRANGVQEITILVREPYYWSDKLDQASSRILQNNLERNNVKVLTGEEVVSFELKHEQNQLNQGLSLSNLNQGQSLENLENVGVVVTKSGKKFECDVVGVGIGIRSNLSWLEDSGLKFDGGIVTNEYLQTNVSDVYAAGDCAKFHDVIFDTQHTVGNWANATSQGHVAAKNMCGVRTVYETASSYSDTFFDGSYSFIGVTKADFADEVISRGSVAEGKMTRIFIKKMNGISRIVGATVINDPAEVAPLTTTVKNKIDILKFKNRLSDQAFDLKEMLA